MVKDIDYELLSKGDDLVVYRFYLRGDVLGLIKVAKDNNTAVISYDFDENKFCGIIGILLINEILISALDCFDGCLESRIYFKNNKYVDYYDDIFAIEKKEDNNGICYFLKK